MDGLRRLESALRRFETMLMAIALIAFVAMVAITTADVGLRYAFNRPLSWAIPVTTNYLLAAVYFGAIATTQRERQNLGIDLVTRALPVRPRAACAALATAASLILCMLICAFTFSVFWEALIHNEAIPGIIAWPLWPSHLLVPLGFGAVCLRLALQLLQDVLAVVGQPPIYAEAAAAHEEHAA